MLLNGKNVIITGTARGIGRAMLDAFAANGANIIAHARRQSEQFDSAIKAVEQAHGVRVTPVYFDLTDYAAVRDFIKELASRKLVIDALINNAGITHNALFQMSREADLRQQFEVNFFSVYLLTQQVSRLMSRHQRGSIINIASSAGIDGNSGKSIYGASKAAVICMTKSIAAELGASKIRANAIAPGITETDMLSSMPDHVVMDAQNAADLRRGGKPSEIADAAVFLASDLSSYMTGQVIRVDGGLK